jgi:hypothetical protein
MTEYSENQPNSPEVQPEKAYVTAAREVIAEATEIAPETVARFAVVDSYVARLLLDVDAGKITGSAGTYSREQLLDQFRDFLSEEDLPLDQRVVPNPYAIIPSQDGIRRSFRLLMDDDATREEFKISLRLHTEAKAEPETEQQQTKESEIITGVPKELGAKAEEAVEAPGLPGPDVAQAASRIVFGESSESTEHPEETEAEMYARFEKEARDDFQEFHRQLRLLDPRSIEADALRNQISQVKEDIGKYAKERRRLQ